MTDSAPPKSRLPRTGTLLLVAVVLIVAVGVLKVLMSYYQEQQAIVEIERLGGYTEAEVVPPIMFERVSYVDMVDTQVSDADLEHLGVLANLQHLSLDGTQVSDDGLTHLSGLTKLVVLELSNTQVTDEGLQNLMGLTNLGELWLKDTQVTEVGIKQLEKALPDCDIYWTQPSP